MSLPIKSRGFALVALVGCAHGSNADQFRRLSRHEAALARAEAERGRQPQECTVPLHEQTKVVCREAASICSLSRSLEDADARTRCARAEATCEAGREHVRVHCP